MNSSDLNATATGTPITPAPATSNAASKFNSQVGISSVAFTINVLILVILLADRKFLKKSAFLFALALANLFVALAFSYASIYRKVLSIYGTNTIKISASSCLLTMIPEFYFLAFSSPALVLMINGAERLVAVLRPTWYFTRWKPEKNWRLVGVAYGCIGVSVIGACVYSALTVVSDRITNDCLWNFVAGDLFAAYFYMVSVVGGLCAVLATLISFCVGTYQYAKLPRAYNTVQLRSRAKRQLQLTKAMLTVACLDFFLIVFPNFSLLLSIVFRIQVPFNMGSYSLYLYNANAIFNMSAHVAFNVEFRKTAIRFLRLDKCKWFREAMVATTTPVGGGTSVRVAPSMQ